MATENDTDGNIASPKSLEKGKCDLPKNMFSDFCGHAAFDGIQYITEERRHWIERIFWLIAVTISICFGSIMIYDAWTDWQELPIIVTISERSSPVSKIPFPAITICPQEKSNHRILNYTEIFHKLKHCDSNNSVSCNVTNLERRRFLALTQVCEFGKLLWKSPKPKNISRLDIVQALDKLSPEIKQTIAGCEWLDDSNCEHLFQKTVTDEGICFSFNVLSSQDMFRGDSPLLRLPTTETSDTNLSWSLQKGYESRNHDSYPYRVFGSGRLVGLWVQLRSYEQNFDFICRSVQGYTVQIHPPDELPQVSKIHFRVPCDQEVIVSVIPQMMTTHPDLGSYDPEIRQCFFHDERYLRWFKIYNQNNCEIECTANYTLQKCGCVRFSVPATIDVPVCGTSDIRCCQKAEKEVLIREFQDVLSEDSKSEDFCNCLPACTSLTYSTDTTQAAFDRQSVIKAFKPDKALQQGFHASQLRVFFKQNHFYASKRSELYGLILWPTVED